MDPLKFVVENWEKVGALITIFSGATTYLATALWKLSRAVTKFESTVENFKVTQQAMLVVQQEDRKAIGKLQFAMAKILTTLKIRSTDKDDEEII